MSLWRLLRCGPWSPGGYEPVPEKTIKSNDINLTQIRNLVK